MPLPHWIHTRVAKTTRRSRSAAPPLPAGTPRWARLRALRWPALRVGALLGAGVLVGAATLGGCEVEPPGDDFDTAYAGLLNKCSQCHAPGAPGGGGDEEKSLDFTSVVTARETLSTGKASGLVGNTAACNGVPFVVAGKPEQSLVVAALDQNARKLFDLPSHPNCDNDAISDMALKLGGDVDAASLDALKAWITAGAK